MVQLWVAKVTFLMLSHLNMHASAVTPGITEATKRQSCSPCVTNSVPSIFQGLITLPCQHTSTQPTLISSDLLLPSCVSAFWFSASCISMGLLVNAYIDFPEKCLWLEYLIHSFGLFALSFAVVVYVFSDGSQCLLSQLLAEWAKTLLGVVEVLEHVLEGGRVGRGVGLGRVTPIVFELALKWIFFHKADGIYLNYYRTTGIQW